MAFSSALTIEALPVRADTRTVTLAELARAIAREHRAVDQSARAALTHAKRAGPLLIDAKRQVPRGTWLPSLRRTGVVERTAQAYMRLARKWADLDPQRVADLPLREALILISNPIEDRKVREAERERQWRQAAKPYPATLGVHRASMHAVLPT